MKSEKSYVCIEDNRFVPEILENKEKCLNRKHRIKHTPSSDLDSVYETPSTTKNSGMKLVIQTDGPKGELLENPAIKSILAPFNPVMLDQPLYLDNRCYHYVSIEVNNRLERLIEELMRVDGVESVYEKPFDLPPV